jgi:UPF0271 protein
VCDVEQVYILDTGAFLSNWIQKQPTALFITTERIIDEIRNSPSRTRVENLISVGRLTVEYVESEFISKVTQASIDTGDAEVLSQTDVELIGLALCHYHSGKSVVLVSSDFAVLNTANYLEISITDLTGKMKNAISWIMQCPACNYRGTEGLECPVCGTTMRRRVRKKTDLKQS